TGRTGLARQPLRPETLQGVLNSIREVPRSREPARSPSGFVVLVLPPRQLRAEAIGAREALGSQPPSVGAIAAPVGILLTGERELAPGGVGPGQAGLGLEGLQVGQSAVLEALQPHATAAPHLGHLLELEDHHLA